MRSFKSFVQRLAEDSSIEVSLPAQTAFNNIARINQMIKSFSVNGLVVTLTQVGEEVHVKRGQLDFSEKQLREEVPDASLNPELAVLSLVSGNVLFAKELSDADVELEVRLDYDRPSVVAIRRFVSKDGSPIADNVKDLAMVRAKYAGRQIKTDTTLFYSDDGLSFKEKEFSIEWVFGLPEVKVDLKKYIVQHVDDISEWMKQPSEMKDFTNLEVFGLRAAGPDKEQIAQVKSKAEDHVRNAVQTCSRIVLRKLSFQPVEDHLGYEPPVMGILLVDPATGEISEIVDEEIRTSVQERRKSRKDRLLCQVQTIDAEAPLTDRGGVIGYALARMRNMFDPVFLDMAQSRKIVQQTRGITDTHTCQKLAKKYLHDYMSIRRKAIELIKYTLVQIEVEAEKNKELDDAPELLATSAFGYSLLMQMKEEMQKSLDPLPFIGFLFFRELREKRD